MSNSKVSITGKQLLIVFFMGLAFAVVYATPFVQYVFYDDLAGALHATNTQLGFLIAIFGIGNLLAPFGGALSDKGLSSGNVHHLRPEFFPGHEYELHLCHLYLGGPGCCGINPLFSSTYKAGASGGG